MSSNTTSAPAPRLVSDDPMDALMGCIESGQPEVVLAGYAGAGKTTLVRRLAGQLLQCAPTSEAEEVGVLWTPHSHRRSFEDGRAWLYTAVTRARSRLWVWR